MAASIPRPNSNTTLNQGKRDHDEPKDVRNRDQRKKDRDKLDERYNSWKEEVRILIKKTRNDANLEPECRARFDRLAKHWAKTPAPCITTTTLDEEKDEEYFDIKTYAMYFKKNETPATSEDKGGDKTLPEPQTWSGCDDEDDRYHGKFPNQKIPASILLHDQNSPLKKKSGSEYIRYFHIPTNNMKWVEKAIARYYGVADVKHNDKTAWADMNAAQRVLCREFWSGQMHGSSERAPVHGRHMRSRCSLIPCNPVSHNKQLESRENSETGLMKGKTLSLFMPYIHWETNTGRYRMNRVAQNARKQAKMDSGEKTEDDLSLEARRRRTLSNLAAVVQSAGAKKLTSSTTKPKRCPLAEYLLLVANIAMDSVLDSHQRLAMANLHTESPVHPRRTLDQYYFSTLKDTANRDKDQVVYRGTKTKRYENYNKHGPRIVMVDQLWLWILDDNTVITSFPRRWGQNKSDSSGVYKSLRVRFKNDKTIKSAYHLALIIIDQCSKVFFDRTKPLDERPEVIDIFTSAIGNVADITSYASESFWRQMAKYSQTILSSKPLDHSYLKINPEGTILRESQDIAEELKIMLRVFHQQLVVTKELKRHIYQAIDPPSDTNGATESNKKKFNQWKEFSQDADVLIELIENRKAEIQDLEDSVQRTCRQILDLLTLKQQQASIVEAKEAQRSALASVSQGQTIMALTLVTVFFLPLGFFAAFFGMNNKRSTGDEWMTLSEQVMYMFSISIPVISIVLSAVFRRVLRLWWGKLKTFVDKLTCDEQLPTHEQEPAQLANGSLQTATTLVYYGK